MSTPLVFIEGQSNRNEVIYFRAAKKTAELIGISALYRRMTLTPML